MPCRPFVRDVTLGIHPGMSGKIVIADAKGTEVDDRCCPLRRCGQAAIDVVKLATGPIDSQMKASWSSTSRYAHGPGQATAAQTA